MITSFNLYRFYPNNITPPEKISPDIEVPKDYYAQAKRKHLLCNAAISGQMDLVKQLINEGGVQHINKDEQVTTYLCRLAIIKQDKTLQEILKTHNVIFSDKIQLDSLKWHSSKVTSRT